MQKVLITPATLDNVAGPYWELLRASGFELIYPKVGRQLVEEEVLGVIRGVCAVIAGSEPYTPRVLQAASPSLRVIARAGVGYDAVDLAAAREHGVAVTITPGTNQDSVAEHTFTLILALAKSVVAQHNAVKAGGWPRVANQPLRGRTLGIAGLGRIGKAVALRAIHFRMRVLAFEPYPDRAFVQQHGITLVPFEQLLSESDYVSLHIPMAPESKYLINSKTLALMKPSAYLVNTARGGLVCEKDLIEALRSRRIAGAGLDVFEEEPPRPSPLLELDNVVLTAHTAGVDYQSRDDMALSAAQAIVDLSRGNWPAEKVVNPEVKEKFRW